jgi:hypothetical protein
VTANAFWSRLGGDESVFNSGERLVIRARRHWAVLLKVLLPTVGIVVGTYLLSQLVSREP